MRKLMRFIIVAFLAFFGIVWIVCLWLTIGGEQNKMFVWYSLVCLAALMCIGWLCWRGLSPKSEQTRLTKAERRAYARPVYAALVSIESESESGKNEARLMTSALIGAALLGSVGAAIGASKALKKEKEAKATFSVVYEAGNTGSETVKVGSSRYNHLMALTQK